jgi:hypothetical protein
MAARISLVWPRTLVWEDVDPSQLGGAQKAALEEANVAIASAATKACMHNGCRSVSMGVTVKACLASYKLTLEEAVRKADPTPCTRMQAALQTWLVQWLEETCEDAGASAPLGSPNMTCSLEDGCADVEVEICAHFVCVKVTGIEQCNTTRPEM